MSRLFIPLYLQVFFQGLVFWYAIEKLFMQQIGFNAQTIGLAIAFYALVTLITETPAGILADRWSRRNVLILTPLSFAFAAFFCGIATNPTLFIVGLAFFGVGMALASGNSEAIIYDSLIEVTGSRADYEKYYGRFNLFHSAGLVTGSLIGGLIGSNIGLRETFFLTIPTCLISIYFASRVREPSVHKMEENPHIIQHLKEMAQVLKSSGNMRWIVAANVSILVIPYCLFELDQLWALALALPVVLYGPLNALLLGSFGLAGPLAVFLKKRITRLVSMIIVFAAVCTLSIQSMPIIATALALCIAVFCGLEIVANGLAQDQVPSRMRSGILSAFSTLATIFYIPLIAVFGYVTQHQTVFVASYLLIPVAVVSLFAMHKATTTIS